METINFVGLLGLTSKTIEERKKYLRICVGECLNKGDMITHASEGSFDNIPSNALKIYPQITHSIESSVKAPYSCIVPKNRPRKRNSDYRKIIIRIRKQKEKIKK